MSIMHPGIFAALTANFYPSTAIIEEPVMTQDAVGEPIPAWPVFLTDLDCRLSPMGGTERQLPDQTYSVASHTVSLASYQDTITVVMRVLIDGVYYDIVAVEHDGNSEMTRLRVQVVE